MRIATISEAKNRLSELIRAVEAGETVVILNRNRPVARLTPIRPALDEDDEARLARLESKGIVRRGTEPLPDDFFDAMPELPAGVSVVESLLEERREGR